MKKRNCRKLHMLLITIIFIILSVLVLFLANGEEKITNIFGSAEVISKDTEETLEDILQLKISVPETAVQGEIIDVIVKAKGLVNDNQIVGIQGELKTTLLEIQSYSVKKDNWIVSCNNTTGVFIAELSDLNDTNSYISSTEEDLLVLKCKVNDNANTGNQTINLTNAIASEIISNHITGTVKIISDTINITEWIEVERVSLNKTTLSMKPTQTETLVATVTPDNANNKEIEWSSSDSSIVQVNNGTITAKKMGQATITAKSVEDNTKTATCIVTVIDGENPELTSVDVTTTNNALTAKVNATDNVGISEYDIKLYKYGEDTLISDNNSNKNSNTHTFTGLDANTRYEVKVIVKDAMGNGSDELGKTEYTKPNSPILKYNNTELSKVRENPTVINADLDTYTIDVSKGDKNFYSLNNGQSWNEVLENKIDLAVLNSDTIHIKVKSTGTESGYESEVKDYYLRFFIQIKSIKITSNTETNEIDLANTDKNLTLTATITPENASNQELEWINSNEGVANIVANGKTATVTGLSVGSTTITVKSKDGSGLEKDFDIIVKDTTPIAKPVTSIEITGSKNTIDSDIGEKTLQLNSIVLPEDADNKVLAWTSSDTEIATVDSTGLVTAKKKGTVTITATATDGSGVKDTFDITVISNIILIEKIEIISDTDEIDLNDKNTLQLTVKIEPLNATNCELTWTSSDTEIATVDSTGVVTAKKEGTVTITVTANDASQKIATYTIEIVNNKKDVVVEEDKEEQDKQDDKEQEEKEEIQATTKDPTSAPTILPDTGRKGIIALIILTIITVVCFVRYRNFKDVK